MSNLRLDEHYKHIYDIQTCMAYACIQIRFKMQLQTQIQLALTAAENAETVLP